MDCEAGGKRLLQLVGLVGVEDTQGVEVLAAPDFELDYILAALDLDAPGVLAAGREQEVLDLVDLLPHGDGCNSPSDATLVSASEGLPGYGGLPPQKLHRQQKRIRVWLPCIFNPSIAFPAFPLRSPRSGYQHFAKECGCYSVTFLIEYLYLMGVWLSLDHSTYTIKTCV